MSKEKFIEELSKELCISKNMLTKYIAIVGTNKENIKDYAENCSLAIVRKDNDFNVDYTAVMLNNKDIRIDQLQKENEHWHKLFIEKDHQFQSVRQRYHLLNRLQADYDKKDKLHLSEMQCFELIKENEQLKKELAEEKEDHELLINDFQKERESLCKQIKQEFDARKRAVEKIKTIRHQICEEIRRKMTVYRFEEITKNGYEWVLTFSNMNKILDQIEQGDK